MAGTEANSTIVTAVITGGHAFDVPGFHRLWRSLPGVDAYVQDLENFCSDEGHVRDQYGVLVFYNMHRETPSLDRQGEKRVRLALEALGKTTQGILILHHALLAYLEWPLWSEIVGIQDRNISGYFHDETVRIEVAKADHPITQGLSAWSMVDETYTMQDAGEGSTILLTTEHPRSLRTIGWTRQYGQARVFCLESGHDDQAYTNPHLREVLARGIRWLAGKL